MSSSDLITQTPLETRKAERPPVNMLEGIHFMWRTRWVALRRCLVFLSVSAYSRRTLDSSLSKHKVTVTWLKVKEIISTKTCGSLKCLTCGRYALYACLSITYHLFWEIRYRSYVHTDLDFTTNYFKMHRVWIINETQCVLPKQLLKS